jgi:hypothetical protein
VYPEKFVQKVEWILNNAEGFEIITKLHNLLEQYHTEHDTDVPKVKHTFKMPKDGDAVLKFLSDDATQEPSQTEEFMKYKDYITQMQTYQMDFQVSKELAFNLTKLINSAI